MKSFIFALFFCALIFAWLMQNSQANTNSHTFLKRDSQTERAEQSSGTATRAKRRSSRRRSQHNTNSHTLLIRDSQTERAEQSFRTVARAKRRSSRRRSQHNTSPHTLLIRDSQTERAEQSFRTVARAKSRSSRRRSQHNTNSHTFLKRDSQTERAEQSSGTATRAKRRSSRRRSQQRPAPQYKSCQGQDIYQPASHLKEKGQSVSSGFCVACQASAVDEKNIKNIKETSSALYAQGFKKQLQKRILGRIQSKILSISILRACITENKNWFIENNVDWDVARSTCTYTKANTKSLIKAWYPEMRINLALGYVKPQTQWLGLRAQPEAKKKDRFLTALADKTSWLNVRPSHPVTSFISMPKLNTKEKKQAQDKYIETLSSLPLEGVTKTKLKKILFKVREGPFEVKKPEETEELTQVDVRESYKKTVLEKEPAIFTKTEEVYAPSSLKKIYSNKENLPPPELDEVKLTPKDKTLLREAAQKLRRTSRDRYFGIMGRLPILSYLKTNAPNDRDLDKAYSKMQSALEDFLEKIKDPEVDMPLLLSFEPLVEKLLSEHPGYCFSAEKQRRQAERDKETTNTLLMSAGVVSAIPCFFTGVVGASLCLAGGASLGLISYNYTEESMRASLGKTFTGAELESIADLYEKDKDLLLRTMFLPLAFWGTTAVPARFMSKKIANFMSKITSGKGPVKFSVNVSRGDKHPAEQQILSASNDQKIYAERVLGRELNKEEAKSLEQAHLVGLGQKGKDGDLARTGNYTSAQIREKSAILAQAGYTRSERRKLIEEGIVGINYAELAQKLKTGDNILGESLIAHSEEGPLVGSIIQKTSENSVLLETLETSRQAAMIQQWKLRLRKVKLSGEDISHADKFEILMEEEK